MADFASLLRPRTLQEFVGQRHVAGEGAAFATLLARESLPHSFFFGPPGTGKTTLAKIAASSLGRPFFSLNATDLKIDDLRKIFTAHRHALAKPVVFIDEVHRLAKNQQEVLLPVMEANEALIIGASTENPFFSLTAAIRSRSMLFEFVRLNHDDLEILIRRAQERESFEIDAEGLNYLIGSSGGDARAMLKLLECAVALGRPISRELLRGLRPSALSDGTSSDDTHYNLASALIKSIRGSDPDAAIYYLARLIAGGESPDFIARRLVIAASEDIGNANPQALLIAQAAQEAVLRIGWPESRIILAQAAIYLACSPKSNSAILAIDAALDAIRKGVVMDVPDHLKDAHYPGAKSLGHGEGYRYPHDFGGYVAQEYLQERRTFVPFKPIAYEAKLAEWLDKIRGVTPPPAD